MRLLEEGGRVKNLKIALVEACSHTTHIYSRTYLPRVGIPTLAAILKEKGHACDIWFQALPGYRQERLLDYDIIGIGSLSGTISDAYRLAGYLKSRGKVVVMGGPHVSFMPEEALEHCDYVVIGEGEVAFPALVDGLNQGRLPDSIPGLAYRLPGGGLQMTAAAKATDMQCLPSPDFTLSPQVRRGKIPPIITTSRGCPHDCSFCSVTLMFGRRYRFKPAAQTISELRPVLHRSVCFGDDNFCANPKRAKELLREMIRQDAVPLRWSGQMTVQAAMDDEMLDLMQRTRCRVMYIGIESVNPETLKKYGKAHAFEGIERCIENLHRHDIGVHGMFVVSADDTLATVEQIGDFAIATDIDTIQICALTPFPGTAAYAEYKHRLLHREWRYFDGMHVVVEPSRCSALQMQTAIVEQLRRFYSLPRVVGAYRRGRAWRVKYRAGGYYLIRRWAHENEDYLRRLQTGFASAHADVAQGAMIAPS